MMQWGQNQSPQAEPALHYRSWPAEHADLFIAHTADFVGARKTIGFHDAVFLVMPSQGTGPSVDEPFDAQVRMLCHYLVNALPQKGLVEACTVLKDIMEAASSVAALPSARQVLRSPQVATAPIVRKVRPIVFDEE
jgi:hypothetical protein